jgi:hypothetical protein
MMVSRIRLFILIAVSSVIFICFAKPEISAQETKMPGIKPGILLQENTTWPPPPKRWSLNVLSPVFVLYDNGLVLFKKGRDQYELLSVELTPEEINSLLEEFKLDEFVKLEESYETSRQLDQPVYSVKYWQEGKLKSVKVFGSIRDNEEDREGTPPAFLKIFDQMISFDHPNVRLWQPGKIEIHLYPYTGSQGESAPWPEGWPDLSHPATKKNEDASFKYSYTIYLDGAKKDKLEQILSGLKEKQAILINEKQWYIAPQRYCLPGEEWWIAD